MNHTRFEKIKRLARQGNAMAQFNIGYMYYYGKGVTGNKKEAMKWYTLAAEQGHVKAQYELGDMYYTGTYITRNNKEAIKWYRRAAKQGHSSTQKFLKMIT